MHNILSARFTSPDNSQVVATMADGSIQFRLPDDDISGGGMIAFLAEGGVIDPYLAPNPTGTDVNAERERRVEAGTDVTLADGTVVALQGRDEDMRNLLGRYTVAAELRAAGSEATMVFRDRQNIIHELTPDQMIELYLAGQQWVEAVYMASWALKDSGAIPTDYADDSRWP